MLIDLHVHSNESDGSFTPEELIDKAIGQNIDTLALCDHDTTAGHKRWQKYGKHKNITLIPGVELSATWEKGNCHILGYNVSDHYQPLENSLRKIRAGRDSRNEVIIEKLNNLGLNISIEEVSKKAGGDVVSRPHMARILTDKGYVSSVQEAFDKYLAKGAAAYADRYRLEPAAAVKLLKEAGGTVVLAHPTQLKLTDQELLPFFKSLIPYGLDGIEVFTPYAGDREISLYKKTATELTLLVTGGSDFHGASKPDHFLGYYRKDKSIPPECARDLLKKLRAEL